MITTDGMSEEDYELFVAGRFAAAKAGEPVVFTNRGNAHARTVLSHLIASAQSSLDIYTGCLSATVYRKEEVRAKVRLLGKGKTQILVGDTAPFEEVSVLDYLQSEIADGFIAVRQAHLSAARHGELNHFAVADKINLRVENNHAEKTAVVILNADKVRMPSNEADLAKGYNELFESLFQAADQYKSMVMA
jgi:hypothetical protein